MSENPAETPTASPPTGVLAAGESVFNGEYEVSELLGQGNSGEVYRLAHPKHGNNRVLKMFIPFYELRQERLDREGSSERTRQIIEEAKNQPYQRREYQFLSSIDHPFIVKVHDFHLETLSAAQSARLREV